MNEEQIPINYPARHKICSLQSAFLNEFGDKIRVRVYKREERIF